LVDSQKSGHKKAPYIVKDDGAITHYENTQKKFIADFVDFTGGADEIAIPPIFVLITSFLHLC